MRFKPGVSPARAGQHLRDAQAELLETNSAIGVLRVRVPNGKGSAASALLKRSRDVEFVEPDALVSPATLPNDPEYSVAWHLPRIGMPAAWDITTGSPEVVIAILDSGIAPDHEDLRGKILPGWNLYDGNPDTTDLSGHGTMVAGTAAASTANGIGVVGTGWASRLLPVRVTNPTGNAYLSTIANGLTWAVDHGARVMNVSFASVAGSATVRTAAQYVQSKGGVVIASAGNCTCDDPTAENPYLISVGATDAVDAVKSFSSRGVYVDLAAPGVMIRTTAREGDYVYIAGTSFSSPIVAGIVALMMAANPSATPLEIESWLEETATDIDAPGYDPSSGFGLVRADLAVAAAASAVGEPPPADVSAPSVAIQSPASGSFLAGVATVEVIAFDDRAVTGVELYADGALVGSDSTAPFSFAWDTRSMSDGPHGLVAAAADAAGNGGVSPTVSVVTKNAVDSIPPTAFVTTPSAESVVSRTVTIRAQGSDDVRLVRIDLLVDGKVIGGAGCTGQQCSVSASWNTKKTSRGLHEIRAEAVDQAGNRSSSPAVRVTVR